MTTRYPLVLNGTTIQETQTGDGLQLPTPLAIAYGGTGATSAGAALTALGAGTVSSVSGTGTVSGVTLTGTVTSTGNLTLGGTLAVTASNFASQTANYILAAPNGASGAPTFRAIVAADIPTLNQNTTGTAAGLSATLSAASGGTGLTSASTAGNVLTSDGTTWVSQAPAASGVTAGKAIALAMIFGF